MSYDKTRSMRGTLGELRRRIVDHWRPTEFLALDGVSLEIGKGEVLGVIGPNGSGKTTLLRMIMGIYHPDEGRVEVRGRVSAVLALGTGFDLNLSGVDNVRLNGMMLGHSLEEINRKLPAILEFADIGDFVNTPMKYYSTGMISRLSFATVVAMEPDILLVDEMLSVGDLAFAEKSASAMRALLAQASCQVIVSHDLDTIERICTRSIWMLGGRIMADGMPGEVRREYERYVAEHPEPAGAGLLRTPPAPAEGEGPYAPRNTAYDSA
jgi:ABC-type polysaccharide/polyol phosphate transport system ATPase subunit